MKLTADASIAVKWFVAEPLSEEARRLLAHRIHLHAPDILLAEFANTIWKKVHRREITDPQLYFDELVNLPEIVTLHLGRGLIERAAQLAVEIDHPVYDCLYLACAEATASVLVTADQRFAKKVAERIVDVWYLGAPEVAEKIEAAATAVVISGDKVEKLIDVYEFFAATEQSVMAALQRGHKMPKLMTQDDFALCLDCPAYMRLVELVSDLSDEERIDLLALGWLGAGLLNDDWRQNLEHAVETIGGVDHHYVAGYGPHWRAGYTRLTGLRQATGQPTLDAGP